MREAKPRGRGRVDLLQPSTLSLQPPSQTASSPSQPKTHFTSLHKILSSLLHSSSPPSTGPKNPKGDPPLPLNRRSPSLKPTADPDSIALSQASHRRQLHQRSPLLKGSPPVGWPPLPQPPPPPQAVAPLATAPPCSLSQLKYLNQRPSAALTRSQAARAPPKLSGTLAPLPPTSTSSPSHHHPQANSRPATPYRASIAGDGAHLQGAELPLPLADAGYPPPPPLQPGSSPPLPSSSKHRRPIPPILAVHTPTTPTTPPSFPRPGLATSRLPSATSIPVGITRALVDR